MRSTRTTAEAIPVEILGFPFDHPFRHAETEAAEHEDRAMRPPPRRRGAFS